MNLKLIIKNYSLYFGSLQASLVFSSLMTFSLGNLTQNKITLLTGLNVFFSFKAQIFHFLFPIEPKKKTKQFCQIIENVVHRHFETEINLCHAQVNRCGTQQNKQNLKINKKNSIIKNKFGQKS